MALSNSKVPVVCETTDSKFCGKCYMEEISDILTLNGEAVSKSLTKADFKTGDVVTLRYGKRIYTGTVDFSYEVKVRSKRSESPLPSDSGRPPTAAVSPVTGKAPQRKRHRSWEGFTRKKCRMSSPAKVVTSSKKRPQGNSLRIYLFVFIRVSLNGLSPSPSPIS